MGQRYNFFRKNSNLKLSINRKNSNQTQSYGLTVLRSYSLHRLVVRNFFYKMVRLFFEVNVATKV